MSTAERFGFRRDLKLEQKVIEVNERSNELLITRIYFKSTKTIRTTSKPRLNKILIAKYFYFTFLIG